MNQYDVIVVGAGNAGLSAAATTCLNGLKTLVLERNLLPGGSASSFCRGRFEFEPSLHEICNIGSEEQCGSFRKLLLSYQADVDFCIEKTAFRVIADTKQGYDITVPACIDGFCQAIEKEVPGSYDSVAAVFCLAEKIDAALAYLSKGKPDPAVLASEHIDFLRMASHSVDECLNALKMPKKAQDIVKTYWPYLGASTSELDFALYATMLSRYIKNYPAVPSMKSHELSLAVEDVIRKNGGDIRYNSEVTELLFDGDRACGVRVGDTAFYADYIVLNCFPETAYQKLMPENMTPVRARQLANARKTGPLFFTVYLGLDATAEELGIRDYTVFLYPTPDSIEQYHTRDCAEEAFTIVNCLNVTVPDASPKGTCTLFLTSMLSEKGWGDIKPEEYKKAKNRIADSIIKQYESKMKLSIRPHIEEIAIAAPPTFARYLATPDGTPYGYEIQSWDTMIARIMSAKKEQFVKGVYFTGAHGERADGYSSTYAHGHSVANQIVREAKKDGRI